MSDPSRSKARPRAGAGGSSASQRPGAEVGGRFSVVRTAIATLVTLLGIAWLVVFETIAEDTGGLSRMAELGRWNYLIGFGLLFVGLALFAHPSTPLGRGRGVVIGMLGCFLLGVVWIVTYYMAGQPTTLPLIGDLAAYNLVVGIGFMAVGFVYATRWE